MNMIEHIEKKPPVRIRSEDHKSMAFLVAFPHLSHNLLDCMDLLKDPPLREIFNRFPSPSSPSRPSRRCPANKNHQPRYIMGLSWYGDVSS